MNVDLYLQDPAALSTVLTQALGEMGEEEEEEEEGCMAICETCCSAGG